MDVRPVAFYDRVAPAKSRDKRMLETGNFTAYVAASATATATATDIRGVVEFFGIVKPTYKKEEP